MGIAWILMIAEIELFSLLNKFYSLIDEKSFQFHRAEINHRNWIVIGTTIRMGTEPLPIYPILYVKDTHREYF